MDASDKKSTDADRDKLLHHRFLKTLESFETSLTTPLIPGELEQWIEPVQKSVHELSTQLEVLIGDMHKRQLEQIADEDPELLKRVESLRDGDAETIEQFGKVDRRVTALAERAPLIEPDEKLVQRQMEELIEMGLGLLIQIRKQESALASWLQEAFNRDRGNVD